MQLKRLELEAAADTQHSVSQPTNIRPGFDLAKIARLLAQFDKNHVESFLVTIEVYPDKLGWLEQCWTLILQSAFVGKAQKLCTQKPADQSYEHIQTTVLAAYDLDPEAYR